MSKFLHETRKMIENLINEAEDLKRVNMQISGQNVELQKQLAESEKEIKALKSKEKKIQLHTKRDWFERCCRLEDKSTSLGLENIELKHQLTEKDAEIEKVEKTYMKQKDYYVKEFNEVIDNLKQQLAEKEEKLEEKTDALKELRQKCFDEQKEHLLETADLYRELAEHNQDKISFAVEQLEKVKASVNKTDKNGYLIKFANLDERLKLYKEIDNQIEQLKKEKK